MTEIKETDVDVIVRTNSGVPADGKLMKSPVSGNVYRVPEWEEIEDGRYRALRKEQVESVECLNPRCESDAFGLFNNGVIHEPLCLDHADPDADHMSLLFTMPGKTLGEDDQDE